MKIARILSLVLLPVTLGCAVSAGNPPLVHIGGRVIGEADGSLRSGWPGVYFEQQVTGPGVTVTVAPGSDFYRVLVDGTDRGILRRGTERLVVTGLGAGPHRVRVEKLTENQSGSSRFVSIAGGMASVPAARARRIEFIGDSHSVGYGNISATRTCTQQQIHDTTDTQQAFGPLVAKKLDADYRVHAWSGFGIVRNYNGGVPGLNLPAIYDRAIPSEPGTAAPDGWQPQLIVINLGTNDFSTPVHAGERWADGAALRADYRASYIAFVRKLIAAQPQARFVLMHADAFREDVEAVAAALNAATPGKVMALAAGPLELTACDWHPSLADHRAMAGRIEAAIQGMPELWN